MKTLQILQLCFTLALCFLGSQSVFAQAPSTTAPSTDTTKYLIVKNDGVEYVGLVLSDDGREVLIETKSLGKIYIPKSDINSMRPINYTEDIAKGEVSTAGVFTTRYQFTTNCTSNSGGTTIVRPPAQQVVVVEQVEEEVIDLDRLGLGLSLLRLDIDNNQTTVYRDAVVEYIVRWENISQIDLDTIDIKVSVPKEISVTSTSAGRYDSDSNVIFYTIDRLNLGEQGSFSFRGIANNGKLGALVNAEATAAYNNPINDAQENATD